jgi:hypothetical protein
MGNIPNLYDPLKTSWLSLKKEMAVLVNGYPKPFNALIAQ